MQSKIIQKRNRWTEDDLKVLTEMVISSKYSFKQIGDKLNRTGISCQKCSLRLGLNNKYIKKTYSVNNDFWKTYNEDTCYFGGFSSADACIEDRKNNHFSYRLTLSEKDDELLKRFKQVCQYDGPLHYRTSVTAKGNYKIVSFYVHNDIWAKDLREKFLIVPRKTNIIDCPKLPNKRLELAWLIGLLDGDGSVTNSNNKPIIKIVSSSDAIIKWTYDYFKRFGDKLKNKPFTIKKHENYSYFAITGLKAAQFIDYVNHSGLQCLVRKWKNPNILSLVQNYKNKYPQYFPGHNIPDINYLPISSYESQIESFLNKYSLKFTKSNDEYLIPDKNFLIKILSLEKYKESDIIKRTTLTKRYHELAQKYRCIFILESEIINSPRIVFSRLKHYLGLVKNNIYARKCEIRIIPLKVKNRFLDKYHIQGSDPNARISLGLFYHNKLINVMTFFKTKESWNLSRFCGINHFNVAGGASKLLAYFIKNYQPKSIYSFADRRWSAGNLYEKLGFSITHVTSPTYFYFKLPEHKLYHKFLFRRKSLIKKLADFKPELSEVINMRQHGWDRIFDCGLIKYEKNLQNTPSIPILLV